jgi:hypothetical protein
LVGALNEGALERRYNPRRTRRCLLVAAGMDQRDRAA